MGDRLKGEVAIVTGAAAGIGQAFSVAMAAEGASLVLADLVNADETVAKIEAVGGKAIAIIADVTEEAAMTSMASVAIEAFGKIDILVNNAGIYPLKSIEDTIWIPGTGSSALISPVLFWQHGRWCPA